MRPNRLQEVWKVKVLHYQEPPICGAGFNPVSVSDVSQITCGNCKTELENQQRRAERKSRREELYGTEAEIREEIQLYKEAGFPEFAIENFEHSHYYLLVEAGLREWAPDDLPDHPNAKANTEAFFAKYF